jgi:hypothetical protein
MNFQATGVKPELTRPFRQQVAISQDDQLGRPFTLGKTKTDIRADAGWLA